MAAVGSRGSATETRIKPSSDAYVGLLGVSLLALTVAMLFAYLNWSQISEKPKAVQTAPVGGGARMPAPPPAPATAAPQGAPAPGPATGNVPQPAGGNAPPPTIPPQQQKK